MIATVANALAPQAKATKKAKLDRLLENTLKEISPRLQDFSNGRAIEIILKMPRVTERLALEVFGSEESAGYIVDRQSFKWFHTSENEFEVTYRTAVSEPPDGVEDRRGTGRIVEWDPVVMHIRFDGNNNVAFYFTCTVVLEIRTEGHIFVLRKDAPAPDPFCVARPVIVYRSYPIVASLEVIENWIRRRKIEHKAAGIIVQGWGNDEVSYGSEHLPLALYRLFKALGPKAFDFLRDKNCLPEEDHEIITGRLKELKSGLEEDNAKRATEPGIVDPNAAPATMKEMTALEESAGEREKDKRMLKIIDTISKAHSYSEWAEIGGLSGKGAAHGVLRRLESRGLVTITDTADGALVKLTPKGHRVIAF